MFKALIHSFWPRKTYKNVPFGALRIITKKFFKACSFGKMTITGNGYSLTMLSILTEKNSIIVSPVDDKQLFTDFFDKYEVEYRFFKRKCKIYFHYRVPERNSTNVISIQEFIELILKELLVLEKDYSLHIRTNDSVFENDVIKRYLNA